MNIQSEIFKYVLRDTKDKIREKVDNGEFSNVTSAFVGYKDIRESVSVDKDNIRQSEKQLVENMVKQIYSFLFTDAMIFSAVITRTKVKSMPVTAKDFYNLANETFKQLTLTNNEIQNEFKNGNPQHLYFIFALPEQRKLLDEAVKVFGKCLPFFENASKAESVYSDKYLGIDEFTRLIELFNGKMLGALQSARDMVEAWDDERHLDYNALVEGFKALSADIIKSAKDISESQAKQPSKPKILGGVSAEEQLRLQTIKQANYLYDELVNDTMRDLESQVPYSARDMYAYFLNDKFAKFIKEHKMPLAKSTSLKQAQDVVSKLNGLFNYISKISEKSCASIVYGNDMMH